MSTHEAPSRIAFPASLHPEVAARIVGVRTLTPTSTDPRDPGMRILRLAMEAPYGPPERHAVTVTDTSAPGPHGPVPVRVYVPNSGTADRGFVWCHGGAFLSGDLDMPEADATAQAVAALADAVVVSVDYRLAVDGVHFPVPLDDVLAAWNWAVETSGLLPIDALWAVGGGSAGGALASALSLRTRDGEGPRPAAVLPVYPVEHRDIPYGEASRARQAFLPAALTMPRDGTDFVVRNYLGDHPGTKPEAFPGDAADLRDLPPHLIIVCEFDDLRESGERYAQQLRDAGNAADLYVELGVLHAHLNCIGLDAAARTRARMAEYLRAL